MTPYNLPAPRAGSGRLASASLVGLPALLAVLLASTGGGQSSSLAFALALMLAAQPVKKPEDVASPKAQLCSAINDPAKPRVSDIRLPAEGGTVPQAALGQIREAAEFARRTNCVIVVQGYSDQVGTQPVKDRAAAARAEAVRRAFQSIAFPPENLRIEPKGELFEPRPKEEKQIARVIL